MNEIVPGHVYELDNLDCNNNNTQLLKFVNRNLESDCEGTTNQEVLRALIERVKFMDSQIHWPLNKEIIHHLRMAISLHEARALIRKTEKRENQPETFRVGDDGHFIVLMDK